MFNANNNVHLRFDMGTQIEGAQRRKKMTNKSILIKRILIDD